MTDMKHYFCILCTVVVLMTSCTHPHLVFLNGKLVEGSPKGFIERSNYQGKDSLGNYIYFPEYDSTGANNFVIVDSIPFEITFETTRGGDIAKITAHAICTKSGIERITNLWLLQYGNEGENNSSLIWRYVGPHYVYYDYNRYDFNAEPHLYEISLVYENNKTHFPNWRRMMKWYSYYLF